MGKTIGYGRLSRDDGDDESTSIFNQKRIIEEFAKQHGLSIDIVYAKHNTFFASISRHDQQRNCGGYSR